MTRRFEFVGGNSAKYWEISQQSQSVSVRYGRLGTPGQLQVKDFPSEDAAKEHVARLVAAKQKKGYQECAVR
jgi:predicted DNA-binding WGR domain protein